MMSSGGWPIRLRDDDEGSILPLAVGSALLALTAVLVCVDATSLYLAQKRVDAVADAAALAGADGFVFEVDEAGEPMAVLTDDAVAAQANAVVSASGAGFVVVSATAPDGRSARVTVAGAWSPPVFALFVPEAVPLEATATSRTALR